MILARLGVRNSLAPCVCRRRVSFCRSLSELPITKTTQKGNAHKSANSQTRTYPDRTQHGTTHPDHAHVKHHHTQANTKRGQGGIEPPTSSTLRRNHATRPLSRRNHLWNAVKSLLACALASARCSSGQRAAGARNGRDEPGRRKKPPGAPARDPDRSLKQARRR